MESLRPEPVIYEQRTCSFHCLYCLENIEIRRSVLLDPEQFVTTFELLQIDHAECSEYQSVQMAQNARKFRKKMKLHKLLDNRRRANIGLA